MSSQEKPTREQLARVLGALREQMMDGYTLMSVADLNEVELVDVLKKLKSMDVISIRGDVNKEAVGRAHVWILPSNRGKAESLFASLNSSAY